MHQHIVLFIRLTEPVIPDRLTDHAIEDMKPPPLSPQLARAGLTSKGRKKQRDGKETEAEAGMDAEMEAREETEGEEQAQLEAAGEAGQQALVDAHADTIRKWRVAVAEKASLMELTRNARQRNEAIETYLEGNNSIYKAAALTLGTTITVERHEIVLDEDGDCTTTLMYLSGSPIGDLPLEVKWWTGAINERNVPVRVEGEIHLTDWGNAHRYVTLHETKQSHTSPHPPCPNPPIPTSTHLYPPPTIFKVLETGLRERESESDLLEKPRGFGEMRETFVETGENKTEGREGPGTIESSREERRGTRRQKRGNEDGAAGRWRSQQQQHTVADDGEHVTQSSGGRGRTDSKWGATWENDQEPRSPNAPSRNKGNSNTSMPAKPT